MSRPYDLLVFDWDGTLADSAAAIVAGMQRTIAELNLPARADQQIRERIGMGFEAALRELYPELEFEPLWRQLQDFRRQLLTRGRHDGGPAEAPLFPGALAALQHLQAEGYRLAVATGKSRASLERSLRHHRELRHIICASRCADETTAKPDPHMLRELLELEHVPPWRALMIGDTEYDVAMARALAMPALGVACGVHDRERLLASGAQALIDDVRQLPGWLQGIAQPA